LLAQWHNTWNRDGYPSDHAEEKGPDNSSSQRGFLLKFDLPSFDGTNLAIWLENCNFYFEYYQTAEKYKV
jgi:hypothetical protein